MLDESGMDKWILVSFSLHRVINSYRLTFNNRKNIDKLAWNLLFCMLQNHTACLLVEVGRSYSSFMPYIITSLRYHWTLASIQQFKIRLRILFEICIRYVFAMRESVDNWQANPFMLMIRENWTRVQIYLLTGISPRRICNHRPNKMGTESYFYVLDWWTELSL